MPMPFSTGRRLRTGLPNHAHEMGQPRYLVLAYSVHQWGLWDRERSEWAGRYGDHDEMTALASSWNRTTRGR